MLHIAASVVSFASDTTNVSPLSKDAADELWIRCQDRGDEFHELFTSVYERLRCLHCQLQGCGRDDLAVHVVVLLLFRRLVTRFQAAVVKHRILNLLVRFATKRSTLEKLQELHRAIDLLSRYLKLHNDPEMTRWREGWDQQCERMYALFEERVAKPKAAVVRLPNAEIAEALGMMKFELEYFKDQFPPNQEKLMHDTIRKVVRLSNVHVPKISAFFISSMGMELGEVYSKVRDTMCEVKRGVYDQETRLVAQYLSADTAYARQLFWRATEIWHGFEHPNVAKVLGESMVISQPRVVWEDAAAQGNFIHYFASESDNHQKRLWRMFLQAGHGLNYIHQQGRTHGNLKCSHILVTKDGTPKICHFELSKGPEDGTFDRWKSPEYNLGLGLDPSKAGDVYAFGLCIIEARTGYIPYGLDCDESVKSRLHDHESYPQPEGMCDGEWDVVRRFVAYNPEDRPTMAQAIGMMEEMAWKEAIQEEAGDGSLKTA